MILFVGDTHCDFPFLSKALSVAANNNINNVIVCGDFGYWPDDNEGFVFLSYLNTFMKEKFVCMNLYFVDGNHEDFKHIKKLPQNKVSEIPEVERCFYIPRGVVHQIDGKNIMGFGGAYSIDRLYRQIGVSWFEEETIKDDEIERINNNIPIDILVCHDAPLNILGTNYKNDMLSLLNRFQIQKICKIVQPKTLIHGHYHIFKEYTYNDIECIGLAHNHSLQQNCLIK